MYCLTGRMQLGRLEFGQDIKVNGPTAAKCHRMLNECKPQRSPPQVSPRAWHLCLPPVLPQLPGALSLRGHGSAPSAGRDSRAAPPGPSPHTQEPDDTTNEDRQGFKWDKFPTGVESKVLFKLCQEAVSSLDVQQWLYTTDTTFSQCLLPTSIIKAWFWPRQMYEIRHTNWNKLHYLPHKKRKKKVEPPSFVSVQLCCC